MVIPVFGNFIFGPKKPFLTGFLRIFFSYVFRRNFSQERGFGGGRRNSCFFSLLQEFFAGISAGQEFLYLLRIPQESGGFRRIPVPAKSCWLWPATKEGSLLSKIWTKKDLFNLSPKQDLTMVSLPPSSAGASWPEDEGCRRGRDGTGMAEQAALMAEALADVALATTIATADADNSRQQTTINNRLGQAVSGCGSDRGGVVAIVAASEAVAAPAVAWHCGGGKQPTERRQR